MSSNLAIQLNYSNLNDLTTEGLILGLFEGEPLEGELSKQLDDMYGGTISKLIERGEIRGELKEFHILHRVDLPIQKVIILGCGKREKFNQDTVRFLAAKGARTARKAGQQESTFLLEPYKALESFNLGVVTAEGLIMGLNRFEQYKTKKKSSKDKLSKFIVLGQGFDQNSLGEGLKRGEILGLGNVRARQIANHPGNFMTPNQMAIEAEKVAEAVGMECSIIDEPELKSRGFGGICGVSAGSKENCKMIQLKYRGKPNDEVIHLAVIGKGLTFDAGGISIKPAQNMHLMKFDMCGGAGVIGAAEIIGKLAPKININIYVPASENLLGPESYKPGDVLNMYSGKTVEIKNTDAEGRLLLADAIALAKEHGAQRIINTATLTGAVLGALGHWRTGLMCRDDKLKSIVTESANECDELLWELPLDPEYRVILHSAVADISNSGSRLAGATTAGIFLNEFAGETPFCHLDIAGTAWVENIPSQYNFKPYLPKEGASGTVARTIAIAAEKIANDIA